MGQNANGVAFHGNAHLRLEPLKLIKSSVSEGHPQPKKQSQKRKKAKEMNNNVKNIFIFVCPKCGYEFTHKFTDEEIEWAEGLPMEITSAQCEKCGAWVEPKKLN